MLVLLLALAGDRAVSFPVDSEAAIEVCVWGGTAVVTAEEGGGAAGGGEEAGEIDAEEPPVDGSACPWVVGWGRGGGGG